MKRIIKKIMTFALTAALAVQALALPAFADTGDGAVTATYNAAIMDVKGGADAIASMTFDDIRTPSTNKLVELLAEYELRASLMLIPYRVEGFYGGNTAVIADINRYLATGTVGVESHGLTHLYMAPEGHSDYPISAFTPENIYNETKGALVGVNSTTIYDSGFKTFGKITGLQTMFPDQDILTFAVPGSSYRPEAMAEVMKYYYAARSNAGRPSSGAQTLDPADTADAGGWYNPYMTWLSIRGDQTKLESVLSYLDTCVNNKGWFITGAHDISENPSNALDDMTPADAEALFAKLKEYQDAGKLWVATYSDATKYVRERQNSTAVEYSTADGLFVKVNMNETTENGLPLSTDVFDMPLTVRVEIPDGWTKVRFRQLQAGVMVENTVDSFVDASTGKTFALVDVFPDGTAGWLTDGNAELPKTDITDVSIAAAKGGANGIVSMTFDDGIYDTALLLNELFAEYGLKGSLMLITDTMGGHTPAQWNEVFNKGYLVPESHSATHLNKDAITSEDILEHEVDDSYYKLRESFPDYDSLTFAIPYSSYTLEQNQRVNSFFYAARSGACALSTNAYKGQIQSLDPDMGYGVGSWYNPYMVRLQTNQPVYNATNSAEKIVEYINKIAKDGGWFISLTHAVVKDDDPKATAADPADMTESQARIVFAAMQRLQEQGKLWVTTYTDATKYVRERQNSTVTAYQTVDGMFVELEMATETEDGLPLPEDIFNMPLTVKVAVPSTWGKLTYSQGGVSKEVACVKEAGANFAYIDLIPNGGPASLVNTGDPTGYIQSLGMKQNVSADDSLTYNLYLPKVSKITGVYAGRTALTSVPYGENMLAYSLGDINITDIERGYSITLKFDPSTGYSDYVMNVSVLSYFEALANSADVTADEKSLAYNFLDFAGATIKKFAEEGTVPNTDRIEEVLAKLREQGATSAIGTATPSNLGTLGSVLTAADMAINEKPYFLFYVKEGFTGTLTVSYTDSTGPHSTAFEVVNGYYHCKGYVIFEIEGVYSLASELTITATGKIGGADVAASGNYSMKNYADGVNSEYVNKLYSWVLAADAYRN